MERQAEHETCHTVSTAADELDVPAACIRKAVERGELRALLVPLASGKRLTLIPLSALADWDPGQEAEPPDVLADSPLRLWKEQKLPAGYRWRPGGIWNLRTSRLAARCTRSRDHTRWQHPTEQLLPLLQEMERRRHEDPRD